MIRISLSNHIVRLKILTDDNSEPKTVEIKNGEYNYNKFAMLIVNRETVILDGDLPIIITDKAKMVDVIIPSVIDIIADKLSDHKVYLSKINAIPEGSEREVLAAILETTSQ